MNEDLQGSGLKAQLSGVPVMQIEIRNALERDRLVYNALGLLPAARSPSCSSGACPS